MLQKKHHAEHTLHSQGTSLGSHQIVLDIKAMRKAISAGFALTDQQVLAQAEQHRWVGGAVCAAAWIVDNTVFVANVGLQNSQLSMPCHVHCYFHICMAEMCKSCLSMAPCLLQLQHLTATHIKLWVSVSNCMHHALQLSAAC